MLLHEASTPKELVDALLECEQEVDFVNRLTLIQTIGPELANRFLPALPVVV